MTSLFCKTPVKKRDPLSDPYSGQGANAGAGLGPGSPSRSPELTGKRRFRKYSSTPHLILQVEVTEFVTTSENRPGRWVCVWRDATPDDVTEGVI